MYVFYVVTKPTVCRKTFVAQSTAEVALVSLAQHSAAVLFSLVSVHSVGTSVRLVAKLALVLPVFRPLHI